MNLLTWNPFTAPIRKAVGDMTGSKYLSGEQGYLPDFSYPGSKWLGGKQGYLPDIKLPKEKIEGVGKWAWERANLNTFGRDIYSGKVGPDYYIPEGMLNIRDPFLKAVGIGAKKSGEITWTKPNIKMPKKPDTDPGKALGIPSSDDIKDWISSLIPDFPTIPNLPDINIPEFPDINIPEFPEINIGIPGTSGIIDDEGNISPMVLIGGAALAGILITQMKKGD
jgi:hypothetical protein